MGENRIQGGGGGNATIGRWKAWGIRFVILMAVLNPAWQASSTNDARQLGRQQQKKDNVKLVGPLPSSRNVLPAISNHTRQLMDLKGGHLPEVPVMLSAINGAMDDFTSIVTYLFGAKGFSQFGIAGAQAVIQNLEGTFGAISNEDLRQRLGMFMNYCTINFLEAQLNENRQFSRNWNQNPKKAIAAFDPFGVAALTYYNHHSYPMCARMIRGGYAFKDGEFDYAVGAIVRGDTYPYGLKKELLANIALNDSRILKEFNLHSVQDAIRHLNAIEEKYVDFRSIVSKYMVNTVLAATGDPGVAPQTGSYSDPSVFSITSIEKMAANMMAAAGQVKSAVTGSGSARSVNMQMPIWMASLQMILLSLYPFVWLLALLPSGGGVLQNYFLTLAWAKSYVIGWALISNLDHWQSTALSLGRSDITAQDKLAMVQTVQQLQMYAPLIMALVIFGPRVAAHSLGRGAGAA